jgi:hypothetical protein
MRHRDSRFNHIIENWTFADATERLALVDALTEDIGKVAFQQSDNTYWRLIAIDPPIWVAVGGNGTPVLTGVGNPDNSLGVNGQLYINEANGDIWTKISGAWQFYGANAYRIQGVKVDNSAATTAPALNDVLTYDPTLFGGTGGWKAGPVVGGGGGGGGGGGFVSPPVSNDSAGTAGDQAYDADGYYLCVATNTWLKFIGTKVFGTFNRTYVSDGDTNGLFYFLGTKNGTVSFVNPFLTAAGTNAWSNPFSGIIMSVSGFLGGQSDPPAITDRVGSHVHVSGSGHWVQWSFGNTSLVVTRWNLQNRDNSADGASSVICEGSNDGASWTALNTNAARPATANVWAGGVVSNPTAWKFVRIRQTADVDYFTIGEIELYGTFKL